MLTLLLLLTAQAAEIDSVPSYTELLPDVKSWTTTKKRVYDTVYVGHETTFYCGCTYADKVVDLSSCGMTGLEGSRSLRTEVEHIVPASVLSAALGCVGSYDECRKENPAFKAAHNDLHNLTPAVGTINLYRSNNGFGIVEGEQREYGECDIEIDLEADRVEPAPDVRGDIARDWFYMSWLYGVPISAAERRIFLAWHKADPVDAWEIERDMRIEKLQGTSNPWVR